LDAVLCFEDGRRVTASVAADRRRLSVGAEPGEPVVIDASGGYWFELTDIEGLTAGSETRWEIRAVADAAPTVAVERPSTTALVTPQAVLPIRVAVKDDLAVHRVALEFERSDRPQDGPRTPSCSTKARPGPGRRRSSPTACPATPA
jgi:hypothetical protein